MSIDRRDDPLDMLDLEPEAEASQESLRTFRPALVKLTRDLRRLRAELLEGFPSRRDVLDWLQRVSVRTLGEIPQKYYREFGRQFRIVDHHGAGISHEARQGVLLAALLHPSARDRDLVALFRDEEGRLDPERLEMSRARLEALSARELESAIVEELRRRLAATLLREPHDRAFRQLRSDATEYIEDADEAGHDPRVQQYVAMRPALDELDDWQGRALSMCLNGLESREQILSWGDVVEMATNGQLNATEATEAFSQDYIRKCYHERSTVEILTGDGPGHRRGRELLAAYYLLPAFNLGVREQRSRSGELPDADRDPTEVKPV